MRVYNTLTGQKEDFITLEEGKVNMYVCGPTVYNYMHIGNARAYVVFDTIRRYLEYKGYDVNYVQNFTDIDDKIINQAHVENVTAEEIADRYINEALVDARGLCVKGATINPRVTREIPEIIDMISSLIDNGNAYVVDGSVFFDTKSFDGYGKLSKKNIDDLDAGSRVSVDEQKRNASDFVLWKPNKKGEPMWESPWGYGRPGWHIECSVMAKKYSGNTIDIHGGGADLIFPHHENEIAQSECANGAPFVKYWLHNGFINIDNKKMSKSKGNFYTLRELASEFSYDAIRFFILSSHYRSHINFSCELLQASVNALDRIRNCIANLDHFIEHSNITVLRDDEGYISIVLEKFKESFEKAMDDDFNTADAIATIFDLVKYANINVTTASSKSFCELIKHFIMKLCSILAISVNKEAAGDAEIYKLIEKRQEARKNKNWADADMIRNELNEMGVVIEDTAQGTRWNYKVNKNV